MAANSAAGGPVQPERTSGLSSPLRPRDDRQRVHAGARRAPPAAHCFSASTIVEFEPQHFQQMAGLVCYYNSSKFHYFYVSRDEAGKHLRVMSALPDQVTADAFTPPIPVAEGVPIELRVEVDDERLHFAYRIDAGQWQWLPQLFDASTLSDEATAPGLANFTGAFVGLACQDLAGTARSADFDWFE